VQTSTEVKVNRYLWPIRQSGRVVWCPAGSLVSGFPRECSGLATSHPEGRKWHRWGQYLTHSQTEPHSVSTHTQWPFSLSELTKNLRKNNLLFTHPHVISSTKRTISWLGFQYYESEWKLGLSSFKIDAKSPRALRQNYHNLYTSLLLL